MMSVTCSGTQRISMVPMIDFVVVVMGMTVVV